MTRALRWLGRLSGVGVALLFAAFWFHAPPHWPALAPRLRLQLALLVLAVAGMLLGWWRERAGGAISLLALVAFLGLEASAIRRLPTLWAVYAMMLPGLFLLAAAHRGRTASET